MASKDYQKKSGNSPKHTDSTLNDDGTLTIQMKDEKGNLLNIYVIDPKTGIGTDMNGKEVNLPKTGNHSSGTAVTAGFAFALMLIGAFLMMKNNVFKKQEDE